MHPLLLALILSAGLAALLAALVLWRGWLRLAPTPDTARFRFLLMRPTAPAPPGDATAPGAAGGECPAGEGAAAPGSQPGAGATSSERGREGGR
jgi:hypothetical protein